MYSHAWEEICATLATNSSVISLTLLIDWVIGESSGGGDDQTVYRISKWLTGWKLMHYIVKTKCQDAERSVGFMWTAVGNWCTPEIIIPEIRYWCLRSQILVLHNRSTKNRKGRGWLTALCYRWARGGHWKKNYNLNRFRSLLLVQFNLIFYLFHLWTQFEFDTVFILLRLFMLL